MAAIPSKILAAASVAKIGYDLFFSSAYVDVVAVFDAHYTQILRDARPVKVSVKEAKNLFTHPIETGESITDHKITQPVEIELAVIAQGASAKDTYTEIKQLYLNSRPVIIQTRTGSYSNMYLAEMPHEETPDIFDAIAIILRFKEAQFVDAQFSELPPEKVKDKKLSSTVDKGTQTGKEPTDAQKKQGDTILRTTKDGIVNFGKKIAGAVGL